MVQKDEASTVTLDLWTSNKFNFWTISDDLFNKSKEIKRILNKSYKQQFYWDQNFF